MELIAASTAPDDNLRYWVRSINVVKLFYVTTGRNAWWNTWITRYSPGCMHSTIESAKDFCEKARVQGSVFYIEELPSIAFITPGGTLVVSEINTDDFLGRLDLKRLTEITTLFPVSCMSLQQMVYVFRAKSPLWPPTYSRVDSSIVTFYAGADGLSGITRDDNLLSFASRSGGPTRYLYWSSRPFLTARTTLHAIRDSLHDRLGVSL